MLFKRCDICNKEIEFQSPTVTIETPGEYIKKYVNPNGEKIGSHDEYIQVKQLDICPTCLQRISTFVRENRHS